MKLKRLGSTFPEEGKTILAVYDNNHDELVFEVIEYDGRLSYKGMTSIFWTYIHNQPERSKREDSQQCEMRCSEHGG